jgi:hypothetical protein
MRIGSLSAALGLAAALLPGDSASQAVLGDPSSVIGALGQVRLLAGGGSVSNQGVRIQPAQLSLVTTPQTFSLRSPETTTDFDVDEVFAIATVGLGSTLDVFGSVGQAQVSGGGYGGGRRVMAGGGARVSPPQAGMIRIGLEVQALRESGEGETDVAFSAQDVEPQGPDVTSLYVVGAGRERIAFTRYDALLGFSVHAFPIFRPYGGALFTMLSGSDDVELSGRLVSSICPRAGGFCTNGDDPFASAFEASFEAERAMGAVAGVVLNANERLGISVEGRFLSQTAYALAAHYRF